MFTGRGKMMRLQFVGLVLAVLASRHPAYSQPAPLTEPITKGQRVFTCGHSFHVWAPAIILELAKGAGIADHQVVGVSGIGGSRVIQHWDLPEEKNKAKAALRTGGVDVLTLSPIHLPDPGIENFVTLALKHNPQSRVTVQEFWLPFDIYDPTFKERPKNVDHNALTGPRLQELHQPYFQAMDEHIRGLNKKFAKPVVFVVPVGQAVIALREKILAGQVPGVKTQGELFTDAIGHPTAPIKALAAYCHFAVIYRRSPIGLAVPNVLSRAGTPEWGGKLNDLLQELAWKAVVEHPLSGVKGTAPHARSKPGD